MPKRIRQDEDIYIAPGILGIHRDGIDSAIDERNNNKQLDPNTLNDKIYIYKRQVNDWFLNRATRLINSDDNGFIVLMICMSYLEGVEQYRQGMSSENGNSNRFFRLAIEKLYPSQFEDTSLRRLYSQSRCGLFHNGMVGGDIIINNSYASSLEFEGHDIRISPQKLLTDIKRDFKDYIADLEDITNTDLRAKFDLMFQITSITY